MADEEIKPTVIEEDKGPEAPVETKQEELPLVVADDAKPEEEKPAEVIEAKAEEPKPEEIKLDWKDKELKAKHRQLQEAKRRETELQRRAEAAEALASKFNQKVDSLPEFQPSVVPANQVEKRAQELLAQQKYLEDCNKADFIGKDKYKDEWRDVK